jgi:hypothetical protein
MIALVRLPVAIVGPLLVGAAAQAAPSGDSFFLATRGCRREPVALSDGAHDARALADRRATISVSDTRDPFEGAERIRAGLRAAGLYLSREGIDVVDLFPRGDGTTRVADDSLLVTPPTTCTTTGAPPRWTIDGKTTVLAIVEARVRLTCRPHIITRALAERRLTFGIDANTPDRPQLEMRVDDGLRAHGVAAMRESFELLDTKPPAPAPAPTDAVPGIPEAELDAAIRCAPDKLRCAMRRALVERVLANNVYLASSARIVPSIKDGRPNGFKLFAVRKGTLYDRLGFQHGDTIKTVNRMAMDNPDRALEAYSKLREAKRLTIELERRGQPITLEIVID